MQGPLQSVWQEFDTFAIRGDVFAPGVAIFVGAAFIRIVSSGATARGNLLKPQPQGPAP